MLLSHSKTVHVWIIVTESDFSASSFYAAVRVPQPTTLTYLLVQSKADKKRIENRDW